MWWKFRKLFKYFSDKKEKKEYISEKVSEIKNITNPSTIRKSLSFDDLLKTLENNDS